VVALLCAVEAGLTEGLDGDAYDTQDACFGRTDALG
jgi:hypothetical protein